MARELTTRQRRFIKLYAGNGVRAARLAGYAGNYRTLRVVASENLAKPYIRQAIQEREQDEIRPLVANRIARQQFWSRIMDDESLPLGARLGASELLGRSEGDFIGRRVNEMIPYNPAHSEYGYTDAELIAIIAEGTAEPS